MAVFLESYNPRWKTEFEGIKRELEKSFAELNQHLEIEHIGSTALPGGVAKPILDIDVILKNKSLLPKIEKTLINLGYVSRGEQGIAGRFAFRQKSNNTPLTESNRPWQEHHLYVCYADSLALKNHLLFRDALKNNPALLNQYTALKKSLVDDLKVTREEYTLKKTEFVLFVLMQAGLNSPALENIKNSNTQ